MPTRDNGITTEVDQLQIGIGANAVLLKPTVGGGLSIRNAADSAAAPASMADINNSFTSGVGAVGAATISASTVGDGRNFVTTLTLTNFVVGALAGAAASLAVGNKIFTFPAGAHVHFVSYMSTTFQCAGTAKSPKVGLGSVIASGAVSVLNGTATFMDYLTEQTATGTTATSTPTVKALPATAGLMLDISNNAVGDVKDVFLNAAVAWAADNTGNLTSTGTICLKWTKLS